MSKLDKKLKKLKKRAFNPKAQAQKLAALERKFAQVAKNKPKRKTKFQIIKNKGYTNPIGNIKNVKSNSFNSPILTAPMAATTLNQGTRVRFSSAKDGTAITFHARLFLGRLQYNISGATLWLPDTTDCGGQYYLAIANLAYMGSSAVPRIAQYFDQWKLKHARMIFSSSVVPNGPAYKVNWCACDSVDHWERLGLASGVTTPTKIQILSMPNSFDFPAWNPVQTIDFPVTKANGGMLYTTGPEIAGPVLYASSVAAERQVLGGTMGVRVEGPLPTATVDIGDMFLDISFELHGLSGLVVAGPAITRPKFTMEDMMDRWFDKKMKNSIEEKYEKTIKIENDEKLNKNEEKQIKKKSSSIKSIDGDFVRLQKTRILETEIDSD